MIRFLVSILFQLFFSVVLIAQSGIDSATITPDDSVLQRNLIVLQDSLHTFPTTDSICKRPHNESDWNFIQGIPFSIQNVGFQILQHHPYFNFSDVPITIHSNIKSFHGNELLFYVIVSLLFFYALLRRTFSKYFNDLFRLFFRTTLKQLQVREQMMQTPLPSFLLNIFFVISGGLYICFFLEHNQLIQHDNFWNMFLYCMGGLSIIYFAKFLSLKLSGWLFNLKEAAEAYIFIVFIINKMIGLFLLPFLVLLAYTKGDIYSVSLTLSWIVVACLIIYRFVLTYSVVRKQVKVNPFHFFLYISAFEIAPLLLIYKGLLVFFHITA
ncbi:MAG: DUF4271 domain-containing protein [Bacteroidia bacterium]|nr:DUF4271 domain-containing protein [Bacteroidia bacterium]